MTDQGLLETGAISISVSDTLDLTLSQYLSAIKRLGARLLILLVCLVVTRRTLEN